MNRLLAVLVLVSLSAFAATKKKKAGTDTDDTAKDKPKKVKVTPYGPCDKKGLDDLKAAMAKAEGNTGPDVASKGIFDACSDAMPKEVADALNDLHHVSIDERGAMMLKALIVDVDFSKAACAKFDEAYNARLAPGEKLPHIFKECDYAKLGLFTDKEYDSIGDLGVAYVTPPLYKWLTDQGMEPKGAKKLVRQMTMIDARKK